MAKKPKTNKRKQAQAQRAKTAPRDPAVSRRKVLRLVQGGILGAVVLGGIGFASMKWSQAYASEHDLSRIGKGIPAVVQVHDPQCTECLQLQRATRKAMKKYAPGAMLYLVADLAQIEGQTFAMRHNVSRVTLVLLDGDGVATQIVRGVRNRAELETILDVHFDLHGPIVQRS